MADRPRMTAAQLANKLLVDQHPDVLRNSAAWMAAELMEAEVAAQIGAELGERTPERVAHRNGYRPRVWDTRVGELELAIPRLRQGSYFPSFLEPRRRAEQALVAVVQEAYVNGVSTRRVDRLVEQLGVAGMSKDQVSRLCRGLDEQVESFPERPLEGRYPYLWLDAKVERVREPGGVRHKALVIAYGVHESGRREVLGTDVGEAETEAFWREFLRGLRARGLTGIRLCISDAHQGLKTAIAQVLGCAWQRCTVHFLRDMLGHVSRAQQPMIAAAIRGIFQATSLAEARERLVEVVDKLQTAAPKVARLLEAAEAELLASTSYQQSTGPSCAAPTRWSGSTARSADAPTSSASFPTTPRCSAWPACCSSSRTTSGSSPAATSPRSPSRSCSTPSRRLPPRRSPSSPGPEQPHDDPQVHHELRLDYRGRRRAGRLSADRQPLVRPLARWRCGGDAHRPPGQAGPARPGRAGQDPAGAGPRGGGGRVRQRPVDAGAHR
jgi:putative transposase